MKKQEITIYYCVKHWHVEACGNMIATSTFKTVKDMKDYFCEEKHKKYVFERLSKKEWNWED